MDLLTQHFPAQSRRLQFVIISHSGEDTGDRHGFYLSLESFKETAGRFPVKWSEFFSVILEAASHNRIIHGNFLNVLFPVHHRRYAQGCRSPNPEDSNRCQGFPFHNSIGALGGSQHGLADLCPVDSGLFKTGAHCPQNSVIDIAGSRIFDFCYHISSAVNQNRIRIRPSNVNS